MVKVVKNNTSIIYFVFLLTFSTLIGCSASKNNITKIKGSKVNINNQFTEDKDIETFILPYRNHVNQDLDSVLAYNPVTQDKSIGKWETNIGNFFAQTTFLLAEPIFEKRENKKLDGCMLNHGGIRSIIPKGNVTSRTAYEIMPFENSVVVIGLTGKEIEDLANYYLSEKKPHPLYGITIYTNKNTDTIKKVEINNEEISPSKIYYIATSDYLANGGDSMNFFKNSTIKYDLEYKLRNLFIDYFKSIDTLPNITTKHIITE